MKVKRHKRIKKTLSFYKNHFGLKAPYNVLADGTFCKAALTWKLNIMDQLPKYFEAEVQMYTTKCAIAECELFGSLLYGPLKILQGYTVHPCKHTTPTQASKCIYNTARNAPADTKLIVATCDHELTEKVNNTWGMPLLYISHSTITLQPPSQVSHKAAERMEKQRLLAPTETQKQTLDELKKKELGYEEKIRMKRKRKGPKGPNPLSCKKKKRKVENNPNTSQNDKKKKRIRQRHKKSRVAMVPKS